MGPGTFKLLFLGLMGSGIPVAIAMAGASLVYVMVSGNIPDYVVIHRMVGGLDSFPLLAVPFFILAGNLMNSAGITNRIYNFALGARGLDARRPRARERGGLGGLRRHVGHGDRGRGGPGHDRDQGDDRARLLEGVRGRRDRRLGHAGPDHPAVAAVRDLRALRQRVGGRALPRRASCRAW